MGTNYYHYPNDPCPTCGHQEEPIHIGKSSFGWVFALHVDPDHGIKSLNDWIERWNKPGTTIKDEYGQAVTPEEMLLVVTVRFRKPWEEQRKRRPGGYSSWEEFHEKNDSMDGPNGLIRAKLGRYCLAHGDGTYDLHEGEFS